MTKTCAALSASAPVAASLNETAKFWTALKASVPAAASDTEAGIVWLAVGASEPVAPSLKNPRTMNEAETASETAPLSEIEAAKSCFELMVSVAEAAPLNERS